MTLPEKILSREAKEALILQFDTNGEVARARAAGLVVNVDIATTTGDLIVGADIHFVVENRDPNDGLGWAGIYWSDASFGPASHNYNLMRAPYETDSDFFRRLDNSVHPFGRLRRRDYGFFGRLAGVREEGPDPNGVPNDASVMTSRCLKRWEGDAHSHGHMPLRDFIRLKIVGYGTLAEAAKTSLAGRDPIEEFLTERYDGSDFTLDENTRVVYWFDN